MTIDDDLSEMERKVVKDWEIAWVILGSILTCACDV